MVVTTFRFCLTCLFSEDHARQAESPRRSAKWEPLKIDSTRFVTGRLPGCISCHPTNSVKAQLHNYTTSNKSCCVVHVSKSSCVTVYKSSVTKDASNLQRNFYIYQGFLGRMNRKGFSVIFQIKSALSSKKTNAIFSLRARVMGNSCCSHQLSRQTTLMHYVRPIKPTEKIDRQGQADRVQSFMVMLQTGGQVLS